MKDKFLAAIIVGVVMTFIGYIVFVAYNIGYDDGSTSLVPVYTKQEWQEKINICNKVLLESRKEMESKLIQADELIKSTEGRDLENAGAFYKKSLLKKEYDSLIEGLDAINNVGVTYNIYIYEWNTSTTN